MKKMFSVLLKAYDPNNPELFLKAKFLLITTIIAIIGLTAILAYTSFTFGPNSTTVLIEIIGFSIMILALISLIRGRYFLAGHIILVTGFSVAWMIMFTEPFTSVLIKLDTIVFILVLLAIIPLMFFKNKNPLFAYFFLNFGIFGLFNYYLIKEGNLTTREYVDYALDNTIAMLFILAISYNLFRIYHQALNALTNELFERKKAESSLKEFRVFLTSIINSMPSIIIGVDDRETIVLWNDETTQLTGVSQSQASGNKLLDVLPQLDFIKSNLDHAIMNNKISQLHKQSVFWLEKDHVMDITIYPLLHGSEQGAVIRLDDISDRLRMEQTMVQSEKMALVGEVAGKMAHDFNNVLGIIMGNAELSILKCHDPKIKKTLELIYTQTLRGKNLTKNLIAFAKDQEPKQEYIKINKTIDLVIDLMEKDLEGIELIKEYKPGSPELLADSGMIEYALVNLIQNAIHATSKTQNPQINIRTNYCVDNIYFEIEDNGCGFSEKHFQDIYSPSFTLKGSNDTTQSYHRSIKGTGYGMANVKKYIHQHKGSIDFESTVGLGTTFTIRLPLTKKELTSQEKIQIRKEILHVNKYILLVEDETAISEIQYTVLTQAPCYHKVDVANTAQIAMDLFEKNTYDFISLDYILPGKMNGMDVYNHVRQTNQTIPILFISGNIEFIESIKNLKQKDTNIDHQSKPCMNTDYVKSINQLLGKCLAAQ